MLVDILLVQDKISGFTSSKVSGHGTVHGEGEALSIVEQVTGRQQRIQFMMHAAVIDLKILVATLKAKFRVLRYSLHSIADIRKSIVE